MSTSELVRELRRIVYACQEGYKFMDKEAVLETMLKAASALEEQEISLSTERAKHNIDCTFLEGVCMAALRDLTEVTKKYRLCACCKFVGADDECESPHENEPNCWTWRGVCSANKEEEEE